MLSFFMHCPYGAATYYGQILITLDNTYGWRAVAPNEIRSLTIRLGFEVDHVIKEDIPLRTFAPNITVIHFDSGQELLDFLQANFYKPPVSCADTSSSDADMSANSDDRSESLSDSGEAKREAPIASTSRPARKAKVAHRKVRARKNHIGQVPAHQEDVPAWAKSMGINLKDYKVHVVHSPVDRASLRTKNNDVTFYRAHFGVGLCLPLDPFFCELLT